MTESLVVKTFKNISYNAVAKVITLFFQAVANIILSRTLSSSDYGITGFAFIFMNFLTQFNDLGINSAVIQRKELDEKGLYTAYAIKAALGMALFTVVFVAAPISRIFFDNPAVVNVLRLLAFNFLINIFPFLPNALLTRELNYKKISVANICSYAVNSSLAITLALYGFKYWSIVFANLSATIVFAVVMNFIRPVKIRILFDKSIAKAFINYGWHLFASGLVVFTLFNADNFIVGAVKGASQLGYYALAFNWGSLICTLLYAVVLTTLFPTFSKIQGEREKIKASYLKVLEYISFLGILANTALFISAREFLIHVLGHGTDKWLPALTALRILCAYGIVRSLLEPVGQVIMAVGKTSLIFKANILAAIIELGLLYPALRFYGIEGVAVVVTIAYVSQYLVYIRFIKKELDIRPAELMRSVRPAIISCAIVLPVTLFYKYFYFRDTFFLLAQKLFVTAACYFLLYGILTNWKIFREARSFTGMAKGSLLTRITHK